MPHECKKSFVLYADYKRHLDLIESAEEYRSLFDSVFEYCLTGYEPENLKGMAAMAFSFIKADIDRNCAKYEVVKEKRREAGRKGGIAKATNAEQCKDNLANLANASNANNCQANLPDNVTDNVTDNGTGNVTGTDTKKKENTGRFSPPSLDEVKTYCKERKNGIDPEYWHNFYESKGWMIGKNKMKDWRAAVRTWEKNGSGVSGVTKKAVTRDEQIRQQNDAVFKLLMEESSGL